MKILKFVYLLTILLAFNITGCSDDEPTPVDKQDKPVDITDPETIAEALTFENGTATVVKDAFPEPSADAAAPKLPAPNDDEAVVGISGGNLTLDLSTENSSNVKGVYLKVDGMDQYYDIVLSETNSNGRFLNSQKRAAKALKSAKTQQVNTLILTLPEGLASGNFCIIYAVYDDENRVSNAIKTCIEVKSNGGENSDFLTANEWAMEMEYYTEVGSDGIIFGDTTVVGATDIYEYRKTFLECPDDNYTIQEVDRLNYMYAVFSADGTFTTENSEYHKELNQASNCETGIVYHIEDPDIDTSKGSWSYNSSTGQLTLDRTYSYEEAGIDQTDKVTEVYTVTQDNGKLILRSEEIDEEDREKETYVMIFHAKN